MKCPECEKELRIIADQVGVDEGVCLCFTGSWSAIFANNGLLVYERACK